MSTLICGSVCAMPAPVLFHPLSRSLWASRRALSTYATGAFTLTAPEYSIRALTTGDFSTDVAAHKRALAARFAKVFDDENLANYIRLAALSLTGKAQSYRAIVMVVGASGSGKGGAVNVVLRAFGGRAMGVGAEWLAQRDRTEIDAFAADVLERQPAILVVDEVGGDTAVGVSRLLQFDGQHDVELPATTWDAVVWLSPIPTVDYQRRCPHRRCAFRHSTAARGSAHSRQAARGRD